MNRYDVIRLIPHKGLSFLQRLYPWYELMACATRHPGSSRKLRIDFSGPRKGNPPPMHDVIRVMAGAFSPASFGKHCAPDGTTFLQARPTAAYEDYLQFLQAGRWNGSTSCAFKKANSKAGILYQIRLDAKTVGWFWLKSTGQCALPLGQAPRTLNA